MRWGVKQTSKTLLGALFAGAAASVAVLELLVESAGYAGVAVSAQWAITPFLVAVGVLYLGLQVRRYRRGRPTWLTAIGANSVLLVAKAGAHGGALLGGVFGGHAVAATRNLGASYLRQQLWLALLVAVLWAVSVAICLLVEHWCTISSEDDDDPGTSFAGQAGGV